MKKFNRALAVLLMLVLTISCIVVAAPVAQAAEAGKYSYESYPSLQSIIGWEGDRNAAFVYPDGSFNLRTRDLTVNFGVPGAENINWYYKEGYLPCSVSEYEKDGIRYTIETFGDKLVFEKDADAGIKKKATYVMFYSRMTAVNTTEETKALPQVSTDLMMPLNDAAKNATEIAAGATVVRDWCIAGDQFNRYGKVLTNWLSNDVMAPFVGTFDEHYEHMKTYWNDRLSAIVDIKELPSGAEELIDAFKLGYIYMMIIKDGDSLLVGEGEYDDWTFDHDFIGELATLAEFGDFTDFEKYLQWGIDHKQYPDAYYKCSWPFAVYLQKTGDLEMVRRWWGENKTCANGWEGIQVYTRRIEEQRTGPEGIMQWSNAIDSEGYWLVDNWSALFGLTTYKYLADALGETEESKWAEEQYNDLKKSVEAYLTKTMEAYDNFQYLPIDMTQPNPLGKRRDALDGNWAAHFMFGRWGWDGYLWGAEQEGMMLDLIDNTYAYGFWRQEKAYFGAVGYSFGGYPGYSSGYNAGYGSTALRGEEYRDQAIKSYLWMIENTMTGPYAWNECIEQVEDDSASWLTNHATGRFGSCPHAWGISVNNKALVESMIAEMADGTRIIGRGVPKNWIADGEKIEVDNIPVAGGQRMGLAITTEGAAVTLTLTGDTSKPVSFELPIFVNNIASVEGELTFDNATGVVTVPAGTTTVTVNLTDAAGYVDPEAEAKKEAREAQFAEADTKYPDVRSNYGVAPLADGVMTVDGNKEEVYNSGAKIKINQISDTITSTATYGDAYVVWQDGYMYVYVEVTDPQVVIPTADQLKSSWNCESVDLYINVKDNDIKKDVAGYRVGVTGYPDAFNYRHTPNYYSYSGYEACAGLFEGAAKLTDKGYAVEFCVPMEAEVGQRVAIQFMINDCQPEANGGANVKQYIRAENVVAGDTYNAHGYITLDTNPRVETELAYAKCYALVTLATHANVNNYAPEQQAELAAAIKAGADAINAATNVEEVNAALEAALAAIDAIKTLADLEAEKLPFTDVTENDWFFNAVKYAYQNGIMVGDTTTTFNPHGTLKRGQLVAMLYRMAGAPEVSEKSPFTDVPEGMYYADAIAWAYENEIAYGKSATTFDPTAEVTREEMAAFLARFAKFQGVYEEADEKVLEKYEDVESIQDYAVPYIAWAVENGIMSGMSESVMAPTGTAKRCQAANLMMNYQLAFVDAE